MTLALPNVVLGLGGLGSFDHCQHPQIPETDNIQLARSDTKFQIKISTG